MDNGAHGYDTERFPLTIPQGRALYHLERLFRSTGAGQAAHANVVRACSDLGLNPARVQDWSTAQCVRALRIMEDCARRSFGLFRDCRTQWQDFAPGGRFYRAGL